MLVRDHMSSKVITVARDCSLADARALLQKHRFRHLPVLHKDRLAGIVSDRDLRGAAPAKKTVSEVMTAKPSVIAPEAPIDEAARLLRSLKVGALPVVEGPRLIGILTTSDILDAFVQLCGVGEPTYHLLLSGGDGKEVKWRVRRVVDSQHGDLKWLYRNPRAGTVHLRVRATNIDDIVAGLEADGFEVSTILSPTLPRRA
ncbi:MAG: acetoin dehydrogenase [Deltaproteobacteria bacterium]|nr:acetoin dehydrogenase [Deltaproteobacteria bacterium]